MAKVRDLENQILKKENVTILIRANPDKNLGDYTFKRKAAGNTSVSSWKERRLKPILHGTDFVIINGKGDQPHGSTKMSTLRNGYER